MDSRPDARQPTALERLDLALAGRVVARLEGEDNPPEGLVQRARETTYDSDRHAWIAGMLGLRGLRVARDEVAAVLRGEVCRFRSEHQEHKLVLGFARTLTELETRATAGASPDGWWLVEQFRRTTEQVGRFRNNVLRRDEPWDSIPGMRYPNPSELSGLVDRFHHGEQFGDREDVFVELHPVRQGFRLMWRFARMAPFPDLNLSFAVLALGAWLRAHGYPLFVPQQDDRLRVERVVRGRAPLRVVPLEVRLLNALTKDRAAKPV